MVTSGGAARGLGSVAKQGTREAKHGLVATHAKAEATGVCDSKQNQGRWGQVEKMCFDYAQASRARSKKGLVNRRGTHAPRLWVADENHKEDVQ
jgi:hypothetical protein